MKHSLGEFIAKPPTLRSCLFLLATSIFIITASPTLWADDQKAIRPFKVEVEDAVLNDLQRRLAATRWPDNPLSPLSDPAPRLPQGPPAKSKFLAAQKQRRPL